MAGNKSCSPSVLCELCARKGFSLSEKQALSLSGYLDLLMRWNKMMNLVGAHHWRDAFEDLITDSFHLAAFLREHILPSLPGQPAAWDLGAGAGLPGIPLRILWQEGSYWMVESREKRTIFLSTVLARYPLPQTHVFRGRAEAFMENKKADLIVSRAFMPWKQMLAFIQGHLTENGCVVFLTKEKLEADASLPWTLCADYKYEAGNTERFFCAFTAQKPRGTEQA